MIKITPTPPPPTDATPTPTIGMHAHCLSKTSMLNLANLPSTHKLNSLIFIHINLEIFHNYEESTATKMFTFNKYVIKATRPTFKHIIK